MPPNNNQPNSSQPEPATQSTPSPAANSSSPPSSTPPSDPKKGMLSNLLKSPLKLIIFVASIIVLFVLIYAITNKKTTTPPPPTTSVTVQNSQVAITKSGLTPANLHIKAGQAITWTNQDSKPHQIAADPYPKNDSIPDFNSTIVLNKGDTLNFSFTKAGTYTYHDQLNPLKKAYQGTVVVE